MQSRRAATRSSEFDTETSVVFGSGSAKVRLTYEGGYGGWRDGYDDYDEVPTDTTFA